MWTRSELKQRAKDRMKGGKYWNYLGASLMPVIASYVVSTIFSVIIYIGMFVFFIGSSAMSFGNMVNEGNFESLDTGMLILLVFLYVLMYILIFVTSFFIIYPVTVGTYRWFIRSREEENVPVSVCFSSFKKGKYLKTVGAMAYQYLFLMLWYLCFFFPIIVKSYSYRMIPFIIADNPGIGAKRALKLSCKMTKGHKMRMFILDLSFIGWELLGMMLCFIGVMAVTPYVDATFSELYDVLKKDAVANGLCTMEELGYVLVKTETTPEAAI